MDSMTLLREARASGLTVHADGKQLVVRGPRKSERLALLLLEQKANILAALIIETLAPTESLADWHFLWEERAAIMEFDGGMTRERAEEMALEDILIWMRLTDQSFRRFS
jgi:hypothetical protein